MPALRPAFLLPAFVLACAPPADDPASTGTGVTLPGQTTGTTGSTDPGDSTGGTHEPEPEPEPEGLFGPDNDWWHADAADVPSGLSGTGYNAGDIAHDFTLTDQNGDEVRLYQFHGQVILLDIFTMWCGPCQDAAPDGEEDWQDYGDNGFVYLAAMHESLFGPPNTSDLNTWGDPFGLTHPILDDGGRETDPYVRIGYPTYVLIDRDMTIIDPDLWPVSDARIEDALYE